MQLDIQFGKTRQFSPCKIGVCRQIRGEPKTFSGLNYLLQYSLPNFSSHSATAYAILRSNGVEVGKGDFIGTLD